MSLSDKIEKLCADLPYVMLRDKRNFSRELHNIRQSSSGSDKKLTRVPASLEKRIRASILEREHRIAGMPAITFPEKLPISDIRDEIIRGIKENQVIIISGETGSGKSTQIPKMCLMAERGHAGKIGCTQPRRIAATTIAIRIAEEIGEKIGQSVGYKIRFSNKTDDNAYIKIMTDGILLAETQHDPFLYEYDTLIIDEAHERSLNIDFLLGILKRLIVERRDLKIIITSATLDTEKFSNAFTNAPVIKAGGRTYPVEVKYMPIDPRLEEAGEITYVDMSIKAVDRLRNKKRYGDILIFMPTEQDVLETCERLEGRRLEGAAILPLFARLSGPSQRKIYSVTGPKIVVATNVAETSLTIPGIKYVIDTGLARISQYQPRTRTTSLPVSPVSQSSADQRKGRCGRTSSGICIRLYSQDDYESRPAFTPPEILRSTLAEVILRMISLDLGHISSFPFIDRPSQRSIKDGYDLLMELGAVVKENKGFCLTKKGRIMARMPLDPKISRMMIAADKEGCIREVAVIASALSIRDPRDRPLEKSDQADQKHAPFRDPDSDFITFLNIWGSYHRSWKRLKTRNKMVKFCKQHFLSFPRMREWVYIHKQITAILKEQKIGAKKGGAKRPADSLYAGIHRSILSGFLSNIAMKKDKNIYSAARGREAMIYPGSILFNKGCPWIVAAEMVKTSRLFARTAARIDSKWLESLGGDLCKTSYSEPHWEKNRGEVRAFEQVTLYGLIIISKRPVSYGRINPEEAHDIFIRSALVQGEVKQPLPFLVHNLALTDKIADMEDRLRRRNILASDDVMAEFYSARLKEIYDIRTLKKMIRERGSDDFLKIKEEDILLSRPDEAELARYPDQMIIGQTHFDCSYRFVPGEQNDGITITIPSGLAAGISFEHLEWGVPGIFKEKVTALIKGLPKHYRKQLVPVSRTVDEVLAGMEQNDRPLVTTLAEFIYKKFGVDIPVSEWSNVKISDHLQMRISLIDHTGRELISGRDPGILRHIGHPLSGKNCSEVWKKAKKKWEKTGVTIWDFGDLPEEIPVEGQLSAYPGLEKNQEGVNIRLFETRPQALGSHKTGVQALLSLHLVKELKFLKRNLALTGKGIQWAEYLGGPLAVEKKLYDCLLKNLFRVNPRTEDNFFSHAGIIRQEMFEKGKELKDQVLIILEAYYHTRSSIHTIENANKTNKAGLLLCAQIRKDLDSMVPDNFLEIYPMDRLVHLPRYLKAIRIRAERGSYDPEKDRKKSNKAEIFINILEKMIKDLSPHATSKKRAAIEQYRWMIEEFKVSLFAQELKTPFPVSEKRLTEKQKEIERMV